MTDTEQTHAGAPAAPRADPLEASLPTSVAARDLSRPRRAQRRYSEEECFANLAMLWRHYGRPPRSCETDMPPSTVGKSVYRRRSGNWTRALRAFAQFSGFELKRTGPERPEDIRVPASPDGLRHRAVGGGTEEESRDGTVLSRRVPLGLRFKVLQRDRFTCAACGNSPATDPACKLHVDHIVQWSRGGKTELGNLRTLCAACNLGRGAGVEG